MAGHELYNRVPGERRRKKNKRVTLKTVVILFGVVLFYRPVFFFCQSFFSTEPTEQELTDFAQLESQVGSYLLGDPAGFCRAIGLTEGIAPLVIPTDNDLDRLQRKLRAARLGLWPTPTLPTAFREMPFPVPISQDSWLKHAKFKINPLKIERLETVSDPSMAREYVASAFVSAERASGAGDPLRSRDYTLSFGTDLSGRVMMCRGSGVAAQYTPQAQCLQRPGYAWDASSGDCKAAN